MGLEVVLLDRLGRRPVGRLGGGSGGGQGGRGGRRHHRIGLGQGCDRHHFLLLLADGDLEVALLDLQLTDIGLVDQLDQVLDFLDVHM
jgi:hypothetical protein